MPREWVFSATSLGQVCLIVGRNSAGKSRLLNVINGLSRLLTGEQKDLFQNGAYKACFADGSQLLRYELDISDGKVTREILTEDGRELLNRGVNGAGQIWAAELNRSMQFESPTTAVGAQVRRDAIQHPFLQKLYDWAKHVRYYQFGTPLGRDRLYSITDLGTTKSAPQTYFDAQAVTVLYIRAFADFKEEFDNAVLADLAILGYDCTDVGAENVDPALINIQGPPLINLFLKERDLPDKTSQINMSAGMFRAFALVIHVNDCLFRKIPATLLIDDIGEGLDFARSQGSIRLLIDRAKNNGLKLIMTTNDRFVMNGVPLEYWSVIHRVGGKVRLINKDNSPEVFKEFEELGLNNFDFFSSNFFEQGLT